MDGRRWTTSGAASRATVWFLADPRRTDLDLFDRRSLSKDEGYAWDVAERPEFGGARPIGAEWYRLSPPDWMVGEGWSLTPEAGGRVRAEGSGLDRRPIEALVRRQPGPVLILVGGYYLGDPSATCLRLLRSSWTVPWPTRGRTTTGRLAPAFST